MFHSNYLLCGVVDWCLRWNFVIDVNRHNESQQEFLMLLKLQYRPSRCIRLVETMVIIHSI